MRARFVVDLDQLGGVLGLLERLGDDQGHGVTDMTHPALRQEFAGYQLLEVKLNAPGSQIIFAG